MIPPLSHLVVGGQDSIHGPLGAQVLAFVEQRGLDLRRRVIHEARLMQHGEHRAALARTERPGRGVPRRRGPRGPTPTIVGRARQPEGGARGGDAQPRSDLGDGRHHEVSVARGVPSNAALCFCSSTRASDRSARFCHRLISRACSASPSRADRRPAAQAHASSAPRPAPHAPAPLATSSGARSTAPRAVARLRSHRRCVVGTPTSAARSGEASGAAAGEPCRRAKCRAGRARRQRSTGHGPPPLGAGGSRESRPNERRRTGEPATAPEASPLRAA